MYDVSKPHSRKQFNTKFTDTVALFLRVAHTPSHVRIYREHENLHEEATLQVGVVEVDGLGCIVDRRLSGNREACASRVSTLLEQAVGTSTYPQGPR